jgi:PAS domain S-box-containing protein
VTEPPHDADVLVVDDSQFVLRVLASILERAGFIARPVRSGAAALAAAELEPPSLVLLDIEMPEMSGFEVCRRFKESKRLSEIPVVFISSGAHTAETVEAFRLGAVDYIAKPFQDQDVVARVSLHIQLHAEKVAAARQNASLRATRAQFQARLEALSRAARDGLIMMDSSGAIAHWNEAAEDMFGYSRQEALGRQLHDLIAPDRFQPAAQQEMPAFVRTGEGRVVGRTVELVGHHKSGAEFPIELSLAGTEIDGAHWAVGVVRDITQRRQAEARLKEETRERERMAAELRDSQRLEAVGRLAAGIAHEINTPAQFVTDNTFFLRDSFADLGALVRAAKALVDNGSPTSECLAKMRELVSSVDIGFLDSEIPKAFEQTLDGLARITKIVGAMKEFSRPSNAAKAPTDLNRAIESTITVSRNEWKYVADLTTDLDPQLPPVICLGDEINQVILNLIVNAAHAIGDKNADAPGVKGTIRVSTIVHGPMVEIRIADSGNGIPESIRHRVFDPFFTTKPVGKGTGQGLAISRSIVVDKHHGTIDFQSEPGVGTTFVIRLPVAGDPPC